MNVMIRNPSSLRQLDHENRCPIVWAMVGEFAAVAQVVGGIQRLGWQGNYFVHPLLAAICLLPADKITLP